MISTVLDPSTDERATVKARLEAEYKRPLREIILDALNDRKHNPRGSVRGAARILRASPSAIQHWVDRYRCQPHTWWESHAS